MIHALDILRNASSLIVKVSHKRANLKFEESPHLLVTTTLDKTFGKVKQIKDNWTRAKTLISFFVQFLTAVAKISFLEERLDTRLCHHLSKISLFLKILILFHWQGSS